ncbi:MAG: hypothetical protein JWP01_3819 [Myxococcales bacterium]|nr:hypothetical protein [Myxococcales bacterium]
MNKHLCLSLAIIAALGACKSAGTNPAIRADISAKLASAQEPIQRCYQSSLTTNRKLRGMYVVQMAAAPDGQFTEINLRRDEPADPVLRFCVIAELAKLKLEKPPGARIVIESVPIKFEWSNP